MREPDDDRDEPTDDEIQEHVSGMTDLDIEVADLMVMESDRDILAWARHLQRRIIEEILEARDDKSHDDLS